MALQAVYKQFLAAPNSSALAQNASLNYITTTTSYNGPTDIIKHLNSQRNSIKKNKEDLLHVIEGQDALFVQTELSLEFQDDGGAYLPGLDDQFLYDRVVYISVSHVVKFNNDAKITAIQQSWDQGALLKQLDVIGKTGRNWPIRDSKAQIKLITTTAAKPAESAESTTPSEPSSRSRTNSANASRIHANSRDEPAYAAVSPKAGARPRQRTFEEILGDEPDLESPERSPSRAAASPKAGTRPRQRTFEEILGDEPGLESPERSPSRAAAPKIGAGKNFQPSRLFEKPDDALPEPGSPDDAKSPEKYVRPHPKKYNHFELGDGSDSADAPRAGVSMDAVKSKHRQTWDFGDFYTPEKPKMKALRQQEIRHWGTDENDIDESPAKPGPGKAAHGKARRDAESHFEMLDDGLPSGEPRGPVRPRGTGQNSGLGLYNNHLVTVDGSEPHQSPEPRALGNITNLKQRSKDTDAHFTIADESPTSEEKPRAPVPEGRKKAVNMMQANWAAYDESPKAQKENKPSGETPADLKENGPNHRIKLGGDGMGNPKGGRGWSIGEDSDEERAPAAAPARKGAAQKAKSSFWDF